MLPADWGNGYPNVWLGMTAEDQERFDQRWKHLGANPAAVRFISYEPALGSLSLRNVKIKPDWLIVGGESGNGARPMRAEWARDIVAECREMGIAPFFKQWGLPENNPLLAGRALSAEEAKKIDPHGKGGGLLDGEIVRQFPDRAAFLPSSVAAE
jgi:protein gp37